MRILHVLKLLFQRDKFQEPAKISRENIKGFLQGNLRAIGSKISFLKPAPHIEEQAWWRLQQIKEKSPECLNQGQCKVCGCSTDEIVFEDRPCKGDCYPAMMGDLDWAKYKFKNKIEIV